MTRYAFPDPPADSSGTWTVSLPGEAAIGEVILYAAAVTPAPPGDYVAAVLASNPIGYWQLADTSGTTAVEEIAARNGTYDADGVTLADVTTPAGTDGPTFIVANGGTVAIADHDVWSLGEGADPFTIECIIRPTFDNADPVMIVTKDAVTTDREFNLYLAWAPTPGAWTVGFQLYVTSGTLTTVMTSAELDPDVWYHVAVTFDPATTPRLNLYVDAVLVAQTRTETGSAWANTGATLRIGARGIGSEPRYFAGNIAHVAIYDVALPAGDIDDHFALLDMTP